MTIPYVPDTFRIADGSIDPTVSRVAFEGKAPGRSEPQELARSGSRPSLQRAQGAAHASFRLRAGQSRLERLYQDGCAKIRLPTPLSGSAPEAVLINTAGGLTGGDRIQTALTIEAGASAVMTTQACERIYRSTGDDAIVSNRVQVKDGGWMAWLPQETILFDGGRLKRTIEADLYGDARFLAVEAIIFGRTAMGEQVNSGALHDRWRIRRDGRLIFADDFRVAEDIARHLQRPAALDGKLAMATVLYAGPESELMLDAARAHVGPHGGASAWGGKLVVRLIAEGSLALRRRLEPLLQTLLGGQMLPKVWQT